MGQGVDGVMVSLARPVLVLWGEKWGGKHGFALNCAGKSTYRPELTAEIGSGLPHTYHPTYHSGAPRRSERGSITA